jgi:hypothetical protein
LLSDLRHLVRHPKPNLGIPPLNRLLEVFCSPTHALPAPRWSSPDPDENVERHGYDESPGRPSTTLQARRSRWKSVIIELTSSLPASGKTNFLYYVTALAVLPSDHAGKGTAVVWFDTDGRFSATRLREVVLGIISSLAASEDDSESLAQQALTHVHVFRPQSSQQLIDTLDHLPTYLLDTTAHSSIRRRLGLLVLDSATAFYWQDRFDSETARFEHPEKPRDKPSRTAEIITRLRKLQKAFDCAAAYSTSSMSAAVNKPAQLSAADTGAPSEARSISPWTALATLTLNLSRVDVPRFASHMSLEDCLRDREKRQEAVSNGKFLAEVDRSRSEAWTADVKEEWRKMEAGGSFSFSIGSNVTVE